MAWICLAELVESHRHLPHGSQPSPIVSVSDTHKAFCCQECQKVKLIPHQSGMMSQHSPPNCCQGLTSLVEDSHAKTSVLQDMEKDWTEAEAGYFLKLSDLQETSDQGFFFSKTSQPSGQGVYTLSSKNCQKSGLIVDGQCFQLQKLGHHIKEKGGSYWRTPNANDSARGPMSLHTALTGGHQISLVTQVKHPELWPTPKARDWKATRTPEALVMEYHRRNSPCLTSTVAMHSPQTSGQLNPEWVEWLMGYQAGATELSAWAMEWFRSK